MGRYMVSEGPMGQQSALLRRARRHRTQAGRSSAARREEGSARATTQDGDKHERDEVLVEIAILVEP